MKVKILFSDVDGTLTDGKLYYGEYGEAMKVFSVKDGHGLKRLMRDADAFPVILTGRESKFVEVRCKELGISNYHQAVHDKISIIKTYEGKYPDCGFAYIGDDDNDLGAMKYIKGNGGIIACPCDASDAVIHNSDYVCKHSGGDGAVREFIEYLFDNKLV